MYGQNPNNNNHMALGSYTMPHDQQQMQQQQQQQLQNQMLERRMMHRQIMEFGSNNNLQNNNNTFNNNLNNLNNFQNNINNIQNNTNPFQPQSNQFCNNFQSNNMNSFHQNNTTNLPNQVQQNPSYQQINQGYNNVNNQHYSSISNMGMNHMSSNTSMPFPIQNSNPVSFSNNGMISHSMANNVYQPSMNGGTTMNGGASMNGGTMNGGVSMNGNGGAFGDVNTSSSSTIQMIQVQPQLNQGQPPGPSTETGTGQQPSSDTNNKKRDSSPTGAAGMSSNSPAKKSKSVEGDDVNIVTPEKDPTLPALLSPEGILSMQVTEMRKELNKHKEPGLRVATLRQPLLFLKLLSKIQPSGNVVVFKRNVPIGLILCPDMLREGKMIVSLVLAENYFTLGCKIGVGDKLTVLASSTGTVKLIDQLDNRNDGRIKADQNMFITVEKPASSAKQVVTAITSNTNKTNGASVSTRQDIMDKASDLAKGQRSAAVAKNASNTEKQAADGAAAAVSTADASTAKKTASATTLKTTENASNTEKQAADGAAAVLNADASTAEKTASAATGTAKAQGTAIQSTAFKEAVAIEKKAYDERVPNLKLAIENELGLISGEVMKAIYRKFRADLSSDETRGRVLSILWDMPVDIDEQIDKQDELLIEIKNKERILADEDPPSQAQESPRSAIEGQLADAKDELDNLDIVKIKKRELARLKDRYTALFKAGLNRHKEWGTFSKMEQCDVDKLEKEWKEALDKATWEQL